MLTLVSGCVVQQTSRIIEGQVALAPLDREKVASTFAPPDWGPRADGTSSALVPGPPPVALSGAPGGGRTSDGSIKRVADDEMKAIVPAPPVIPPAAGEYPLDLATALKLADVANPTIGRARTVILEALAGQLAARTLLLPSLNSGGNYHGQNGALQRPTGRIELISEQSLYLGAGAGAVGSGTPAIPGVNILAPLTDAWFEPLAAHQRVEASRSLARATENDILMDVAVLYLELIRHDTLLETDRLSEFQAFQIVQAISEFAITGQGRQADFDRAKAEWRYRRGCPEGRGRCGDCDSSAGAPTESRSVGPAPAGRRPAGPARPRRARYVPGTVDPGGDPPAAGDGGPRCRDRRGRGPG